MPRSLGAFLLATILFMLPPAPALACSCGMYESARAQVEATDVIFVGRVIRTEAVPFAHDELVTTFEVLEELKGDIPRIVRVRHPAPVCCLCFVTFTRGAEGLVFAHRYEGRLHTSLCSAPRFPEAEYRASLRR
jgi:hypothetical protein